FGQDGGDAPAPEAAADTSRAAPGDWVTINRTLGSSRYSPLEEINTGNVASLVPGWTFEPAGGSSVPLVVDGVMYVSSGPNVVALDADTGATLWSHALNPPAPEPAPGAGPG